jgi:hypothetical protein
MPCLINDVPGNAGYQEKQHDPAQRMALLWSAGFIRNAMPGAGERPPSFFR